jgi:Ca2+-binding RTX toxin-like protein
MDWFTGTSGDDFLIGGKGADTFDFFAAGISAGEDMITDCELFSDRRKFQTGSQLGLDQDGSKDEYENIFTGIIDQGAGKNVVLQLVAGGSITFVGIGTGSIDRFSDLVANASTRVIIS